MMEVAKTIASVRSSVQAARAAGKKIGFKPAGGISGSTEASIYFTIVKSILGDGWLVPDLFRIGASRLANKLLSILVEQDTDYF